MVMVRLLFERAWINARVGCRSARVWMKEWLVINLRILVALELLFPVDQQGDEPGGGDAPAGSIFLGLGNI